MAASASERESTRGWTPVFSSASAGAAIRVTGVAGTPADSAVRYQEHLSKGKTLGDGPDRRPEGYRKNKRLVRGAAKAPRLGVVGGDVAYVG